MENRDLYMREIEKMVALIAKIIGLTIPNKKNELLFEINAGYKEFFDLLPNEIFPNNSKIKNLLESFTSEKKSLKKLDVLIKLISIDYEANNEKTNLKLILISLIKKYIELDKTNFSIEKTSLLKKYES